MLTGGDAHKIYVSGTLYIVLVSVNTVSLFLSKNKQWMLKLESDEIGTSLGIRVRENQ